MQVVETRVQAGKSASQLATENLYIDDRLERRFERKRILVQNISMGRWVSKRVRSKLHVFIIGGRRKPTPERPLEWACHQFVDVL